MTSYNFDLGRAIPVCRGEYSASTAYEYLDWVTCDGSSWLCVDPLGATGVPVSDDDTWFLVARGGEKGDSYTVKAGKGITIVQRDNEYTININNDPVQVDYDLDSSSDRFVTASASVCGITGSASSEFSVLHIGDTELAIGSTDGSVWVRTRGGYGWGSWQKLADESVSSDHLKVARTLTLSGDVTGAATTDFSTDVNISVTVKGMDASKITSGKIDIDRLPARAIERVYTVPNTAGRLSLTTTQVQEGDSVREADTGKLYVVINDALLNSEDGYASYNSQELPRGGVKGQVLVSDGVGGGVWRWPGEVSLDVHTDDDHLTWLCVPGTLTEIAEKQFKQYSLSDYDGFYGPGVLSVGASAFSGSTLKAADLPVCRQIGSEAFADCSLLTKLWIPSVCATFSAPYLADTVTVWTDSSELPWYWDIGNATAQVGKTHEEFLAG